MLNEDNECIGKATVYIGMISIIPCKPKHNSQKHQHCSITDKPSFNTTLADDDVYDNHTCYCPIST